MRISPLVLAIFMLGSTAHAQRRVIPLQPLRPFEQRILDIHNRERAAIGAPPLRWNIQLERDATDHAQQMARTGRLVHAPREGRGIARENLSQGLLGWGPDQLMRNWLNEKRYFRGGVYPNVCAGGWSQCAHYTQVIWPGTTDIGCGMAAGGRYNWFVCRYSPGGNKDGKLLAEAVDRSQSNVAMFCASSGKELRSIRTRLEQLKARRADLAAEIARVERAIAAADAGLANYDPSLLERLLGTTQAPSNEQLAALGRRLVELQDELRSNEAETKALLAKLQKIRTDSGMCGRGGDREEHEEERRPY